MPHPVIAGMVGDSAALCYIFDREKESIITYKQT